MNKFGMVLGVAAVATLAGCKDPDYNRGDVSTEQSQVKTAETTIAIETTPSCKCPPGTRHTSPCTCGAPDCKCIVATPEPVVEVKPLPPPPPPAPVAAPAAAEETTTYIVQRGDYLAKISKKFNVTINSIKRVNGLKSDTLKIGQKLKLPGKLDVGVQKEPVVKPTKAVRKAYTPYSGATKEYVVKSGDTLGAIAYGNGCNIRQLKELNGLSKDALKIGQKLKIPAAGKAGATAAAADKKAPVAKAAAPAPKKAENAADAKKPETKAPEAAPKSEGEQQAAPADDASSTQAEPEKKAAAPATATYMVQEGDDMTGISIRWGVSAAAIRELNNLPEDAQLTPGQVLKLPADAQQ